MQAPGARTSLKFNSNYNSTESLPEILNELKFMRISAQTLMKPGFISNVDALCRRFKWILLPYAVLYPLLLSLWELCTKMKNSIHLAWKFRNSTLQMLSCQLQIHIDPHLFSIWKLHIFAEQWEKKIMKMPKLELRGFY